MGMISEYDMPKFATWRCSGPCNQLIYNIERVDGQNCPVPGSPESKFISTKFPKVCNVCWEMYLVVNTSQYWKRLDETKVSNNKKLKNGESGNPDYL